MNMNDGWYSIGNGVQVSMGEMCEGDHYRGKIVATKDGVAWLALFGSMGTGIKEFLASCDAEYVARKMENPQHEINWSKICKDTGNDDIRVDTVNFYSEDMIRVYGEDWGVDLPQMETRRFQAAREAAQAIISWLRGSTRKELAHLERG